MSHLIGFFVGIVIQIVMLTVPLSRALAASEAPPETTASFLLHAAAEQHSEITLGKLAVKQAASEQVKEFGARMVAAHQKAQQEVQRLANKSGLELLTPSKGSHTKKVHQLVNLSGKDFDHEYITTILREHVQAMKKLEQQVEVETNQEIQQWAVGAVALVEEHLATAKTIAASLGISVDAPIE